MDYLYSLYDALVGINVPNDKARAVVDAMERDMTTTIATKTDLRYEIQLLKQELIAEIRKETHAVTILLASAMVTLTGLLFVVLKLT